MYASQNCVANDEFCYGMDASQNSDLDGGRVRETDGPEGPPVFSTGGRGRLCGAGGWRCGGGWLAGPNGLHRAGQCLAGSGQFRPGLIELRVGLLQLSISTAQHHLVGRRRGGVALIRDEGDHGVAGGRAQGPCGSELGGGTGDQRLGGRRITASGGGVGDLELDGCRIST